MVDGMRCMGFGEDAIDAVLAQQDQDDEAAQQAQDFEIHDDNWDSWVFFREVQTQWIYAAGGMCIERVGLNYAGVESAARMSGKPRKSWPGLLADLQVMELAVLEADAELAEAAKNRK